MRYETSKSLGDVYITEEYEGTPEEISQLKKLLKEDTDGYTERKEQ